MFYMNLKAGHEFSLVLKSVHVASDLFKKKKKKIFFSWVNFHSTHRKLLEVQITNLDHFAEKQKLGKHGFIMDPTYPKQ